MGLFDCFKKKKIQEMEYQTRVEEINNTMEKRLANLYNELAAKVISIIPGEWEKIYFLGEVESEKSGWSSVFFFNQPNSDSFIKCHNIPKMYGVSEEIYEDLLDETNEILLNIYDCFIENNQEIWQQLSFSINKNGSYTIDFINNVINDNVGPMERECIWAYETFGNLPKEGTFQRKKLDEYINKNKNLL